MSVVAARVYKDKIVMAADSIVVRGWSKRTDHDIVKINEINGMIVGSTGYAQELSLMWQYMTTHKPASATEKDVLTFVVEFSRWKRDLIGSGSVDNTYLMAYDGHLFQIEDMLVYEVSEWSAVGAGEDFANAVLYMGNSPRDAVRVACELSCLVAEPIIEYSMQK
jgi:hypothetical protein